MAALVTFGPMITGKYFFLLCLFSGRCQCLCIENKIGKCVQPSKIKCIWICAVFAVFFSIHTFGTFFCHSSIEITELALVLATTAAMRLAIQFLQQSLEVYELAVKRRSKAIYVTCLSHLFLCCSCQWGWHRFYM